MLFYKKAFSKHRVPRFIAPGRIDIEFYEESKKLLSENSGFKFRSELDYWKRFRIIFIVFVVFVACAILLTTLLIESQEKYSLLLGILFFIMILTIRPVVYFLILMSYYLVYRMKEKKFHKDFKSAVIKSRDFDDFTNTFYVEKYAERTQLREYIYDKNIDSIKEFAQKRELISHVAIYKYAKGDHYVVLTNHEDLVQFIEYQGSVADLNEEAALRWSIKTGTVIPFDFGNKRLKKLMI
jgi:hypothetical protein